MLMYRGLRLHALVPVLHRFVNGQPLQWDHLPDVWWWSEKPDDAKHVSLEREGG